VKPDELKLIIRANIDKAVSVTYADGGTEKVFVHTVECEGFVCDIGTAYLPITEIRLIFPD
jgi:hypothetical protein